MQFVFDFQQGVGNADKFDYVSTIVQCNSC